MCKYNDAPYAMFTFCARAVNEISRKPVILRTLCQQTIKFNSYFNSFIMSTSWSCIYINGPDKSIYFRTWSQNETESSTRSPATISKLLTVNKTMYIFFPHLSNSFSDQNAYLKSAVSSHKVYRQNGIWPSSLFAHSVMFDLNDLSVGGNFRRGVFCSVPDEFEQETSDKIKAFLYEHSYLSAYKLDTCKHDGHYTMKPVQSITTSDDSSTGQLDGEEFYLELIDRSEMKELQQLEKITSPIFFKSDISPVFHNYKSARLLLEQLSEVPEVKELLDITDKYVAADPVTELDQSLNHPFVVVEGMDATGKTTLTEELERRMGAARYFTPPPQLTSLRAFFDKYPEIVRRAYYSMGNYIVARDIIKECQTRPVIMDRFWHSTAAYGIANESSLEDMPGTDHAVYHWPKDLLKPTIVLFLTVSEDVRKQRLSGRGVNPTFEEKSLDKDQLFRVRLCESYRNMVDPCCIEIDAGGTIEEVQNMAIEVLSKNGVKLDK